MRARLVRHRMGQKRFDRRHAPDGLWLGIVPAGHREQIANRHCLEVVRRIRRRVVGKKLQHGIVKLQLSLLDRQPNGGRIETLAERRQTCGLSAASGFHQPSPITWPCRTIMKLCSVLILSAASTKSQTACDEMPWASGVLRGSERLAAQAQGSAARNNVMLAIDESRFLFMAFSRGCKSLRMESCGRLCGTAWRIGIVGFWNLLPLPSVTCIIQIKFGVHKIIYEPGLCQ